MTRGLGRDPRTPDDGRPPRRQLDEEKTGPHAGTPANLIRRPVKLPPMERVQRERAA